MDVIIDIPKIIDYRGNISVLEKDTIPFDIKRVYYLYDVPSNSFRGSHAHIEQTELLIAVSGCFEVVLKNTTDTKIITLNRPDKGLLIKPGIWRELQSFSSCSVCLVIASGVFSEDDYIRSFDDFLKFYKEENI